MLLYMPWKKCWFLSSWLFSCILIAPYIQGNSQTLVEHMLKGKRFQQSHMTKNTVILKILEKSLNKWATIAFSNQNQKT